MANDDKTTRIFCNTCKTPTRHNLIDLHKYHSGDSEIGCIEVWGTYFLWACAGCDTCVMEDRYATEYGPDEEESIFHPRREHSTRPRKHFTKLPRRLDALYNEVVSALNEDLPVLCASGLRSLLEGLCAEQGIQGSNLQAKIDGMTSHLPENIVKNLHAFRFMGNRAVHELEHPAQFELSVALDVIEDLLNFLYTLDYKASMLAKFKASQSSADVPVAQGDNK